VRNAFERGEVNYKEYLDGSALMTFESNIAYTLRFMIDHHVRLILLIVGLLSGARLTFPCRFPLILSSTLSAHTSSLADCRNELAGAEGGDLVA
jgi:hypothetical protein